jgi:hypothetical protein
LRRVCGGFVAGRGGGSGITAVPVRAVLAGEPAFEAILLAIARHLTRFLKVPLTGAWDVG